MEAATLARSTALARRAIDLSPRLSTRRTGRIVVSDRDHSDLYGLFAISLVFAHESIAIWSNSRLNALERLAERRRLPSADRQVKNNQN
jgi:hypothetical protein